MRYILTIQFVCFLLLNHYRTLDGMVLCHAVTSKMGLCHLSLVNLLPNYFVTEENVQIFILYLLAKTVIPGPRNFKKFLAKTAGTAFYLGVIVIHFLDIWNILHERCCIHAVCWQGEGLYQCIKDTLFSEDSGGMLPNIWKMHVSKDALWTVWWFYRHKTPTLFSR